MDCAHHTRVPVPILNDSTTDRDDVYTTLRPLGDSTAARDTSDSGLEELQQLRKFITTDPVLKGRITRKLWSRFFKVAICS